jgi:hypothetical protein
MNFGAAGHDHSSKSITSTGINSVVSRLCHMSSGQKGARLPNEVVCGAWLGGALRADTTEAGGCA